MQIKYPKILRFDESNRDILTNPGRVIIEEKVDGANFSFYVEDNIIYFCSRNQNLTDSKQIEKTGIPKGWRGIEPVLESFKNDPLRFVDNFYYFGESLQRHTIKYNDDIPGFIGFDIFDMTTEKFIDYRDAKSEFENIELEFINIIAIIDTQIFNASDKYLESLYQKSEYRDGSAEGIVIKRYDTQQFIKIVDDKFKEKNEKVFGKSPRKQTTEDKIIDIYVTDARIEKVIYKLHDEGHEITMRLMEILYKHVNMDMLEEEIIEIYKNYNSIDFKNLNRSVSKKCSIVLKKVIRDNQF